MTDDGEITRKTREENTAKSSKKLSSNLDIPINPKEQGIAIFGIPLFLCE